jgi:SnoaL-like domain
MKDPGEMARRVIEAVNAHDLDALRRLYAPDARTRRPGWPQDGWPDELLASYAMDFACVPDIRFEPVSTLALGDGQESRTAALSFRLVLAGVFEWGPSDARAPSNAPVRSPSSARPPSVLGQ